MSKNYLLFKTIKREANCLKLKTNRPLHIILDELSLKHGFKNYSHLVSRMKLLKIEQFQELDSFHRRVAQTILSKFSGIENTIILENVNWEVVCRPPFLDERKVDFLISRNSKPFLVIHIFPGKETNSFSPGHSHKLIQRFCWESGLFFLGITPSFVEAIDGRTVLDRLLDLAVLKLTNDENPISPENNSLPSPMFGGAIVRLAENHGFTASSNPVFFAEFTKWESPIYESLHEIKLPNDQYGTLKVEFVGSDFFMNKNIFLLELGNILLAKQIFQGRLPSEPREEIDKSWYDESIQETNLHSKSQKEFIKTIGRRQLDKTLWDYKTLQEDAVNFRTRKEFMNRSSYVN